MQHVSQSDLGAYGGEIMHHETSRLGSFATWPSDADGWPSALARAGLYYEGVASETRCFSCKQTMRPFRGLEDVFHEHRRLSPQCQFVLGKDKRNVPFNPTADGLLPPEDDLPILRKAATATPSGTAGVHSGAGTLAVTDLDCFAAPPASAGTNPGALSNQDITVMMKREKVRFLTYSNWPRDNPIQPQHLAEAGLYYTGPYDRVKCAFCHNVLRNWVAGDDPLEEHSKYYPQCPFVQGASVKGTNAGNIPKENDIEPIDATTKAFAQAPSAAQQAKALGIVTDRPRHQVYAIESSRLKTFAGYPPESPVTPADLSRAGFFYTGSGDCVRCFYCDMGLRHWEPGDDPWEEHARWYPRCNFIISVKGDTYVQQIQRKYGRASFAAQAAATGAEAKSAAHQGTRGAFSRSSNGSSGHTPLTEWLNQQMAAPVTRTILEMGYSKALVSSVLERRHENYGFNFLNVQSFLEAIFEMEESNESALAGASLLPAKKPTEGAAYGSSQHDVHQKDVKQPPQNNSAAATTESSKARHSSEGEGYADEKHLMEENRHLKEQRTCRVCMDNESNLVFLPCGHLCCCSLCAPALRKCPICRQLIRGTVRIYMS